jgi:hypothetical protein
MTEMQGKIAEIMKSVNLEEIAQQMVDKISAEVADHADLIAIARCEEKGVEDYDSHDAVKIYDAAEAMIINAVIRHMSDFANQR